MESSSEGTSVDPPPVSIDYTNINTPISVSEGGSAATVTEIETSLTASIPTSSQPQISSNPTITQGRSLRDRDRVDYSS